MVDVVHFNNGVWDPSLGVFVFYDSFNASVDLFSIKNIKLLNCY